MISAYSVLLPQGIGFECFVHQLNLTITLVFFSYLIRDWRSKVIPAFQAGIPQYSSGDRGENKVSIGEIFKDFPY